MADRRITVLNPVGYQEVLQAADRLFVDSASRFADAEFTQDVTFTTANFSGNITINGTPSANTDAATVEFVNTAIDSVELTAQLPIFISNQIIQINSGDTTDKGIVRFATNAEALAGSAVAAAVTPDQMVFALNGVVISGVSPIQVTETTNNNFQVTADYATSGSNGVVQFATDAEVTTGTIETVAVNPKQVKDAINAIPYATDSSNGLIRIATASELSTGTNNSTAVTPAQVAQVVGDVDVTVSLPLTVQQTGTVFDFDINYASQTTDGILRIATSAEMTAGTSTNTVVTPAALETRLGGIQIVDGTTTTKGLVRLATNSEVIAGTESAAAVAPSSLRAALDDANYLLDAGTY